MPFIALSFDERTELGMIPRQRSAKMVAAVCAADDRLMNTMCLRTRDLYEQAT
jgi:hypothetical protein